MPYQEHVATLTLFSKEDKIVIKNLYECNGYNAQSHNVTTKQQEYMQKYKVHILDININHKHEILQYVQKVRIYKKNKTFGFLFQNVS